MEHVAFLIEETNERIEGLLNPESLLVRRRAGVRSRRAPTGEFAGAARTDDPLVYTGGGRTEMVLELLFDTTLAGSTITTDDVRDLTRPLWDLAEKPGEETSPRPLLVRFVWGKSWNVPGVVIRVSERLERFTEYGAPQRSWLTMEFLRVDVDPNVQPAPPVTPPASLEEAAALTDANTPTHEVVGGSSASGDEGSEADGPPDADALLDAALEESGLNAAISVAEQDMDALMATVDALFPPEEEDPTPLAETTDAPEVEETEPPAEPADVPEAVEELDSSLADAADAPEAVDVPEAHPPVEVTALSVAMRAAVTASVQAVAAASAAPLRATVSAALSAAQATASGAETTQAASQALLPEEDEAQHAEEMAGTLGRISETLGNAAAAAVAAVRERAAALVAEATLTLNAATEADTAELDRRVSTEATETPEASAADEESDEAESGTEDIAAGSRRADAEAERTEAETARLEAETERVEAETDRARAEVERADAEAARAGAQRDELKQMRAVLARSTPARSIPEPLAPAHPAEATELNDRLGELGTLLQALHARREEDAAALATRLVEANARALRDLRTAEEARASASYLPTARALASAADGIEQALAPEASGDPTAARSADGALRDIERAVASVKAPAEAAALEPARQAAQQLQARLAPETSGATDAPHALDVIRAAPEAVARAEQAAGAETAQAHTARLAEQRRTAAPEAAFASPETYGQKNPEVASGGAVHSGERLEHAAYRYYRDPALWRLLAHANDLDDPLRLPLGLTLRIPSARSA